MPVPLRTLVSTRGKAEEDEKINDGFISFVYFQCIGICRDEHPSGRWHDAWWMVVGNVLRWIFCDHYRESHYWGYIFDNETKVMN